MNSYQRAAERVRNTSIDKDMSRGSCDVAVPAWQPAPRRSVYCIDITGRECT